jgi:integrase
MPNDIVETLNPLGKSHFQTAQVILGRIRALLDFAIKNDDHGRYPHGNAAAAAFGRMPRKRREKNPTSFTGLETGSALYAALMDRGEDDIPAMALRFLLLCCRPRANEIVGALWREIDGDVFHVPVVRMKLGKKRDIPLSGAAMALLDVIPRKKEFIFTGRDGEIHQIQRRDASRRHDEICYAPWISLIVTSTACAPPSKIGQPNTSWIMMIPPNWPWIPRLAAWSKICIGVQTSWNGGGS